MPRFGETRLHLVRPTGRPRAIVVRWSGQVRNEADRHVARRVRTRRCSGDGRLRWKTAPTPAPGRGSPTPSAPERKRRACCECRPPCPEEKHAGLTFRVNRPPVGGGEFTQMDFASRDPARRPRQGPREWRENPPRIRFLRAAPRQSCLGGPSVPRRRRGRLPRAWSLGTPRGSGETAGPSAQARGRLRCARTRRGVTRPVSMRCGCSSLDCSRDERARLNRPVPWLCGGASLDFSRGARDAATRTPGRARSRRGWTRPLARHRA